MDVLRDLGGPAGGWRPRGWPCQDRVVWQQPSAELDPPARTAWQTIAQRAELPTKAWAEFGAMVARTARIDLHFHPYRRLADGRSVADGLWADGCYRSQYATGISNGSPTAHPGGDRDEWERRLFGGAYHSQAAAGVVRPKYGALDLMAHADGAAPRFGCCFFRLRPGVSRRATFCWQDSHLGPTAVGVCGAMGQIWRAVENQLQAGEPALGLRAEAPQTWRSTVATRCQPSNAGAGGLGRLLDDYIEAQVHGQVQLASDVEALVVDAGLRSHAVGQRLEMVAERYQLPLEWQPGLKLRVADIPVEFRGPELLAFLAHAGLSEYGTGELARLAHDLEQRSVFWSSFAAEDDCLQYLKQAWHALAALGQIDC